MDSSASYSTTSRAIPDSSSTEATASHPPPFGSNTVSTSKTAVFLQDACFGHRFIRSHDTSAIVERPERLRAVQLGLAAAIARLEVTTGVPLSSADAADDLAAVLERMNLATSASNSPSSIPVINSTAKVDILNHPAVKFIHGDVDGDVYLENLQRWAKDSLDKIAKGVSEIPEELSQGDLYRQ